ncbi:unnamed protein product, partial [Hapterophycus canaliculatus]
MPLRFGVILLALPSRAFLRQHAQQRSTALIARSAFYTSVAAATAAATPLTAPASTAGVSTATCTNTYSVSSPRQLCTMSEESFSSRSVDQVVLSREQAEGQGALVRRSIGGATLRNFDPFLLLDEFDVATTAGFPDHPHRGFETVTYMLKGVMEHEDFCGHRGKIGPGSLQWMTAGKGIVHAEMPTGTERGHGLQLWVNLKSADKMVPPAYQ